MLKLASRDETVSRTQTFDWFSEFKSGVMAIDAEGLGHLSTKQNIKCGVIQGTCP
jgi:hypothetical protein